MTQPPRIIRSSLLMMVLLTGCGDRGGEPPTPAPQVQANQEAGHARTIQPPAAVRERLKTVVVALRAVPEVITAPGEVALDLKQVAKITSRIEGQIEQIHVQLGDRVKKGQALAAIGSLQLDQLIEEYLVSKAQSDVAENNLRRTEKLRAEDIVPERKLVEDNGRYLETKARYQHIREKLLNMGVSNAELTELERGRHEESHRYTLTSPISGTIVEQNAVRGQGVAPGNELFQVVDTSRVWVFANLPIELARKFKEGDQGTIVPKGGEAITAALAYIAPVADEKTRTVKIRFDVPNSGGRLKPNEFVEVSFALEGSPALAVPASALTMVEKTRGLFVRRPDGFAFTTIETGREADQWIEVKKGLQGGEEVVSDGVFDLKNVLLKEHIESGEAN
ncbi:MAG: efflux RND transporter periplasmic adaptor subunit [Nitrospira sp.]|nr:efflux RND transporter periplasmic adaptor subunit [Nitrospira sp.]